MSNSDQVGNLQKESNESEEDNVRNVTQSSQEESERDIENKDDNRMDTSEIQRTESQNDDNKENDHNEKMDVDESIDTIEHNESQTEDIIATNVSQEKMDDLKSVENPEKGAQHDEASENTNKHDVNTNITDDNTNITDDNTNITDDNTNIIDDNTNITNDNTNITDDNTTIIDDNTNITDDNTNIIDNTNLTDNTNITDDNTNITDDKNKDEGNYSENVNADETNKNNENVNMECTEKDETTENSVTENITATENIECISNMDEVVDENNEDTNKSNETADKREETADKKEKTADKKEKTVDKKEETTDKKEETADKTDVVVTESNDNEEPSVPTDTDVSIITEKDTNKDNNVVKDSSINDENAIFVQVNTEKDDLDKSTSSIEQGSNDVDPIGSSDWNQNNESTFISELDEADECIIPDANREESISVETTKEADTIESSTSVSATPTVSDSMNLSEKYLVSIASGEERSTCMICNEKKVYKYNCSKDNVKTNICSEECLNKLKEEHQHNVIVRKLRVKNFSLDKDLQGSTVVDTLNTTGSGTVTGTIHCVNCRSAISDMNNSLSWEAFDFCDEQCLTKHQRIIGSYCANCTIEVKENFLGKYCVRFGYNVRQFCSSTCLEEYKKSSKVCSYCQDDISGNTSGFLTSIGDRGLQKDFCSAQCMQLYSQINKHLKGAKLTEKCCVCHKNNIIEIEFEYKGKNNQFCGEPCFVAFKYVNDVSPEKCDMCCKYFISLPLNQYLIRYDGVLRKFCRKTCQNIYITTNRKIVSCCWCKVKKYNFDMIQKYISDGNVLIVCSLTCLNFFNASISATKVKRKRCDFCHKICKGQYHITLADDSMKNFCSYPCVQEYQNKYLLAPARYTEQPVAVPSNTTSRVTRKTSGALQQRKQIIPDVPGPLPIITSVRSLAPAAGPTMNTRSLRSRSSVPTITTIAALQTEPAGPPPARRIILLRPPDLPLQRNVATLAKPITADVEVEFKVIMVDKAVQTEDLKDSLILVPIPVPIYMPSPMQMYNLIHPIPIPFSLPIPIPMFIPVTKQMANVVLKEMKKNQIRTPTDPYEADLLMMAELVAGENEKKENTADADAEGEVVGENAAGETTLTPEPQDASTTFGDDMLQMALKMATDFEEPAVDLEGALTASTITATAAAPNEQVDEVAPIQPPVERTTFRGRRRGRPPRHGGRGRGRGRPPTQPEVVPPAEPEPQPPPAEPVEKPDANMCLKYTFGVNAWKQWVTTKNAELEKSSRRPKLFKSDLLQLTSDELNYSLCLFVKEVRKPNGAEYAPDTIYYLCLGIQQYLFENGRIDNIFCDSYYESFTDCLDEVCKKFSTLYNDSQYIVTRVEEEHLWESKQLGAHSPHVLLSTLMFFNTKHFNLTNVEEHMQLSFSHIMKHWKRVSNQPGTPKYSSSRNILLRFYPPQSAIEGNNRKKKVYEQQENEENPLRCPVKLYEFYLSKCPESVKTRNDVFYLLPERSCVPDSPVWYSTMALGKEPLEKMLHRVKMVKEINVALLAS